MRYRRAWLLDALELANSLCVADLGDVDAALRVDREAVGRVERAQAGAGIAAPPGDQFPVQRPDADTVAGALLHDVDDVVAYPDVPWRL